MRGFFNVGDLNVCKDCSLEHAFVNGYWWKGAYIYELPAIFE